MSGCRTLVEREQPTVAVCTVVLHGVLNILLTHEHKFESRAYIII